jgi:hypothetical protein
MTDEEIAAVAAVAIFAMDNDERERRRQPISPWAKAARDYDADDERCSRRF